MPPALRDAFIGLERYEHLCEEAGEGERLEYLDGEVVRMMVGGSTAHHALTRRLDALIADRLVPGSPCAGFRETRRLAAGSARFYPDVFVACGEGVAPDPERRDVPGATVIVEVLSPSTERYDRGRKWLKYQSLPDLRHFALVAQDQCRIEAFHRQATGWHYELLVGPDAVLRLDAIGVELRLGEVYAVLPVLAGGAGDFFTQAAFTPAQVAGIAGLKGLAVPSGIEALLAEMEAEECAAAVAALVAGDGARAWIAILPERLHARLNALPSDAADRR